MRWWEGIPAVDAPAPSTDGHRLRWEDGDLQLPAHPDPDAERALGALGGERCACLDVWDAWHRTHRDGGILTVAGRHPLDELTTPEEGVHELRTELRRWRSASGALVEEARAAGHGHAIDRLVAVAGPAEAVAERRLGFLLLLTLPPALLIRLQGSVAAALAAADEPPPVLTVATASRARPILVAAGWRGDLDAVTVGDRPEVDVDRATLPPAWVADVWSRGLGSALSGAIVLQVVGRTTDGGFEVLAAEPGKPGVARRVAPVGQ